MRIGDLMILANGLNISKRSVKTLLKRGDGLFWQRVGDRLRLIGLEQVSIALDCEMGPGRGVFVPLTCFRRLEVYRANLYAAWFASRPDGQIITREVLTELFGRTRQCLRRWERLARIDVAKVLAYAAPRTLDTPTHILDKYPDGDRTWKERIRGQVCEVWQLPNHYSSSLLLAQKGMFRRIRRACRRALVSVDGQRWQRLFYDDPRGAAKALEGGQTAFLSQGRHHGRRLYAFCCA